MSGLSTSAKLWTEPPLSLLRFTTPFFHHHPSVSAITDAQAVLCDHDLWPAKPEPVLFDKQTVSAGKRSANLRTGNHPPNRPKTGI
jgi:hypothetical protein